MQNAHINYGIYFMQHNNYTDVTGLTLAQLHYRAPTKEIK